jgi:hypothetical protein
MNVNLVLATGLAYAFVGALMMFLSHRAIYKRATRIVAGYPRVLAALRVQRHDGHFGLVVLLCGNFLQLLAACGYEAPLAHWRYPALAAVAVLCTYGIWRLFVSWRATRASRRTIVARQTERQVYETRRSIRLLEAARREGANRLQREQAKGPPDRSVVYLVHDWECRWWSDKFGVAPAVLKAAVRQVGPMVVDIERYLAMRSRKRVALAA